MLKDPPVLILDEATSALDARDRGAGAAGAEGADGRPDHLHHRPPAVHGGDPDEILVFGGSRIQERGTFDALVRQGGRFAELVKTQLAATPLAEPVKAAE